MPRGGERRWFPNRTALATESPIPGDAELTYPERRFPPRAGMAPGILTCPAAAMGATGSVTDPGMSEAISGIQQRREVLSMPEKLRNTKEVAPGQPKHHLGACQGALSLLCKRTS